MSFKGIYVGKIKSIDYKTGVGEIVTEKEKYIFLIENFDNSLNVDDIVKFRGEKINDTLRAFFVKKISKENINNNYKVLKSRYIIKSDEY